MRTFTPLLLIFAISGCSYNSLPIDGGVESEPNNKEQVAHEVNSIKNERVGKPNEEDLKEKWMGEVKPMETLLNEIVDHRKKSNRISLKEKIIGKLEALAKRAIETEAKNEDLLTKKGELKKDMVRAMELEAENKDLLTKNAELKKDVKQLVEVAKDYVCAKGVRYGLDIFKDKYLSVPEDGFQRRNRILKTMKTMVDKKRKHLTNIVTVIFQKTNEMEEVVKNLNEMMECKSDYSVSTSPSNGTLKMNLTTTLLQFCKVNESEDIKQIRTKQNDFWNNFDMTSDHTLSEMRSFITKFGYKSIIIDLLNTIPELEFDERRYARETLLNSRVLFEKVSERHNDCSWIMYMSNEPEIHKIIVKLTDLWPDLNRGQGIDRFCHTFSALYNVISNSDFHSFAKGLPPSCEPESKDYISYINKIAASTGNSNMAPVALLVRQLPLPTNYQKTSEKSPISS